MKSLLVGSTGFVGGNLMLSHDFEASCNSRNIKDFFGSYPDLCIYAGIPAEMFLANNNPEADLNIMREARKNIACINPKQLVLISSVAVYKDSSGKNENSIMETDGLPAYGADRLQLEQWIREDYPKALIIRLPALYGVGLKKNFLYDLHSITPSMLTVKKYDELKRKSPLVESGYSLKDNGFYCINGSVDAKALRNFFMNNDFNALSFTDSRSKYQFYSLSRLWNDIQTGLENRLTVLNLCTPPVTAQKVYEVVTGVSDWHNETGKIPLNYDMRSLYADKFGGIDGYLCLEEEELEGIYSFMASWRD